MMHEFAKNRKATLLAQLKVAQKGTELLKNAKLMGKNLQKVR